MKKIFTALLNPLFLGLLGLIALALCSLGLFGLRPRQLVLADELDAAWVRVEDNH